MRGVETRIQEIRHAVFTEVAKMAYEEGPVDKKIEALPYKIIQERLVTSEMMFSLKGQS